MLELTPIGVVDCEGTDRVSRVKFNRLNSTIFELDLYFEFESSSKKFKSKLNLT